MMTMDDIGLATGIGTATRQVNGEYFDSLTATLIAMGSTQPDR